MMDHRLIEAETKLTPLQRQLLSLIGEGKTDHQIARELNIDEAITKAYIAAMLCKLGVNTIPRSRHDPKILWVDDAEIVGDRITKVRPIPRNLFTQKTERRIGELGASCVALVVSDVSVHEAP